MNSLHKKSIILLLFTFSVLPAIAQVGDLRNNFSVGVNAGVNFNNVSFTPRMDRGTLMGFAGGLTARYISEKYFAMICGVQIELNYTQRGWKEILSKDDPKEIYHRTMDYLEIPFLTHLAFGRERGVRFFVNLGPQIAFLLNENEKYTDQWKKPESENEGQQYGKDTERKFDYGIVGGLGLELRTKAGNFLIEGRYYFGLSDIFNNTKKDPFSRSAHNIMLGRITYLFDLSR